ncbi:type IV pilin protein [Spongiibacter marinus]|uniref:type IV pilin protein n=1 Tax=Spongiibacter marinus TaxID=354246 RepID=UPI00040DEF48|nr:type IV pilin protein [Spongiibacter marinus]
MRGKYISGFTLIELMITVAIIGILAAIALPSYQEYVVRTNRSAAQNFAMEVANMQERYYLDNRAYAADLTALGASLPSEISSSYTVSVTADNTASPPSYIISAAPKGAQASRDDCGTLTLNNKGEKGYASGATRCWE